MTPPKEIPSLFSAGDRIEYRGADQAFGTVTEVRGTPFGPHYRVAWDDGQGSEIEYGEDEIRAA